MESTDSGFLPDPVCIQQLKLLLSAIDANKIILNHNYVMST